MFKRARSTSPYMLVEAEPEEASYKYYIRTYHTNSNLYVQTRDKTECDLRRTFLPYKESYYYMLNGVIYEGKNNTSASKYFTKIKDSNLISMGGQGDNGGLLDSGKIELFESSFITTATSSEDGFEQLSWVYNGGERRYSSYKWIELEVGYAIKNKQLYRVEGGGTLYVSKITGGENCTNVRGYWSNYVAHNFYGSYYNKYYALCICDGKLYQIKNRTLTLIETEYPIEKFAEQMYSGYSFENSEQGNKYGPYLIDTQGNAFYLNGYSLSLTKLPSKYQKICMDNMGYTYSYLVGVYGLSNGRIKVINNATETDLGIEGVQDVCGALRASSASTGQGFYAKDKTIYCLSRVEDSSNEVKSTKVIDLPEEEELVSLQGGTYDGSYPIFVITRVKQ